MDTSGGKLSATDQEILKQFRRNISNMLTPAHTDAILMKWLRAGNFDLKKCEVLFREGLSTRAVYEIDTFADNGKKPDVAEKFEFVSPLGFAKDGTPVCYVAMGRGDYHGFISSISSFELCTYGSLLFEKDLRRAKEQSKKTGKELNEITYIIDMEGFSLKSAARQCVIETALDLIRMMQDLYPEVWKKVFIVNAFFIFHGVFNFLKPIFRHNLLHNIYMATKETTPELLLKYIDEDVLPLFLGGSRVDSNGDPMCREFLKFGGKVPEEYYSNVRFPLLDPTDLEVENVLVRARCCYNHPIVVRVPNSRLHIELRAEGGSVATTILFKEFGSDPNHPDIPPSDVFLNENDEKCNVRLISPCVKLQLHLTQVDVYCRAPWPGIYIFRFDNTGNWVSSRRLIFRIQVESPHS